jgi:hypothetical protein
MRWKRLRNAAAVIGMYLQSVMFLAASECDGAIISDLSRTVTK